MNKAFIREPDDDGRAYCPRCGTLGVAVGAGPLDTHIQAQSRTNLQDSAWYCGFTGCDVVYFNQLESVVLADDLNGPVYPIDPDAPLCPCFGFTRDDIEADVDEGTPTRIRALLAKSQSPEARCQTLAIDGQCCIAEVQKLYMKLRG